MFLKILKDKMYVSLFRIRCLVTHYYTITYCGKKQGAFIIIVACCLYEKKISERKIAGNFDIRK